MSNLTHHMRRLFPWFVVLACATGAALADLPEVELNYRLQPDRDLTADSVADAITTMRVLEDRGIVAKSGGRLSAKRTSIHLISKQSYRYVTGTVQPDRSFPVEMHYLDKTTHLKGPDGQEHLVPEKTPLKGVRVAATVERDGKVREGSVVVSGVESALAEQLQGIMAAVLAQATSIRPIVLAHDRSVPQDIDMQVPLPGLPPLNVKMRISNQLQAVDAGVARVQQVYSMDFGTPAGPMKMTAVGSGGGTLLYEMASQTLLSSETGTLMRMTLEAADGVLEIELNSRQTQTMRPTVAGGR